ncbi:MAG: inositol monophosphatase [Candidatus Magasanikbacteria bacterium]|nr:inositol monophosphatase [Candidatus Magasanikbacteria bacterium]
MRDFLRSIMEEAGSLSKTYFDKGVSFETKSNLYDLLTEADLAVSDFLVNAIHREYPEHQISSEERETPINPGADYEWVIDPIDGTRNFANGIPLWCHIIAVEYKGETLYAGVYNSIVKEFFFAEQGKGASMNGMPIKINAKPNLVHSVGSFSRHYENDVVYGTHAERYIELGVRLLRETKTWLQSHGTVLPMCYVASGGLDFFLQNAGLDHDFLAPVLICREAGARVTDSDGNEWRRGRQDIVIANPKIHERIMELMRG